MSLTVREMTHEDEGQWDEFVRRSPAAVPHHLLGWREVIRNGYGLRPRYLVARNSSGIVGVMPLFEVRSLLQGHHFTTPPGGICAQSTEAGLALLERAQDLVAESGARFLAIRDSRERWDADLVTDDSQCTVVVDLSPGLDAIRAGFRKDLRAHIRKAEASGLTLRSGMDQLNEFYAMFSAFVRQSGTPVFGKRLLTETVRVFDGQLWLLGIWEGETMAGGGLQFLLGDTMSGVWGASLAAHFSQRPNHLMYWESIRYGCQEGFRRLDLGRCRIGSGQHKFKLQWGGEEVPLYQQFHLRRTDKRPLVADDVASGRARPLARLWGRLPLPVTRLMGPVIRRHLPFV